MDIKNFLTKTRIKGVWLVLFLGIACAHHEMSWLGIGIGGCGLLIRLWASGHIVKACELATSGPYAYTRNPLYLGSMVMGIGFCLALRNYYLIGIILALFTAIYYQTILAEECYLLQRYGEKYQTYLNTVPRLIPRSLRPKCPSPTKFRWEKVLLNREYKAVLGFFMVLLTFDLTEDILFPWLSKGMPFTFLVKRFFLFKFL